MCPQKQTGRTPGVFVLWDRKVPDFSLDEWKQIQPNQAIQSNTFNPSLSGINWTPHKLSPHHLSPWLPQPHPPNKLGLSRAHIPWQHIVHRLEIHSLWEKGLHAFTGLFQYICHSIKMHTLHCQRSFKRQHLLFFFSFFFKQQSLLLFYTIRKRKNSI